MATVPRFRALRIEDIDMSDTEEAFRQLIGFISSVMETQSDALQNNITYEQNIAMSYREFNFTTPTDYATNFTTITAPHNLRANQAKNVQVAQIQKVGSSTSVTTLDPVTVDWYDDGAGNIVVKRITGLEPATQYFVRLFIA